MDKEAFKRKLDALQERVLDAHGAESVALPSNLAVIEKQTLRDLNGLFQDVYMALLADPSEVIER